MSARVLCILPLLPRAAARRHARAEGRNDALRLHSGCTQWAITRREWCRGASENALQRFRLLWGAATPQAPRMMAFTFSCRPLGAVRFTPPSSKIESLWF